MFQTTNQIYIALSYAYLKPPALRHPKPWKLGSWTRPRFLRNWWMFFSNHLAFIMGGAVVVTYSYSLWL
jgi:hypothetical protein